MASIPQIILSSGGHVTSEGSVLSNFIVSSGAVLTVSGGDVVSAITVAAGGTEILLSGATDRGTTLQGGTEFVASGAVASFTNVDSGGFAQFAPGGSETNAYVLPGGTVGTTSGAFSIPFNVPDPNNDVPIELYTPAGAGTDFINEGSTASGLVVSNNGELLVAPGDVVSGLSILTGGYADIQTGAIAVATLIHSGGSIQDLGTTSRTVILNGGEERLYSRGTVESGALVLSGGSLYVASGASALDVLRAAGAGITVDSGGVITYSNDILLTSGGTGIDEGTTASGLVVASGAVLAVSAGDIVSNITVQSGGFEIDDGGTDTGATVQSGGSLLAVSGGMIYGTAILSGGRVTVSSGGTAMGLEGVAGADEKAGPGGLIDLTGTLLSGANLDYEGVGGTIVIAPTVVTSAGIGGGYIRNDAPGDFLTVQNLGEIISDLGYPSDSGYATIFQDYGLTIAPDGSVSSDDPAFPLIEGNATLYAQISTIALDIEHDLFGLGTLAAPVTLGVVGEMGNTAVSDVVVTSTMTINYIPCYAAGTRVLGLAGEMLVEDVRAGDWLVTMRPGGPAARRVVWVGSRRLDLTRIDAPERARPIRIRAGAIAAGVPERDLRVSPWHALYLHGHLFEARHLVNGSTIIVEHHTSHVTYHHIELDAHDVILAEGCAAESYLDTGNRDMFEGPVMALHARFGGPRVDPCVPVVAEGALLEDVRASLTSRARQVA
jgi:autotransporter passenger strand-loop-strand repeat protein